MYHRCAQCDGYCRVPLTDDERQQREAKRKELDEFLELLREKRVVNQPCEDCGGGPVQRRRCSCKQKCQIKPHCSRKFPCKKIYLQCTKCFHKFLGTHAIDSSTNSKLVSGGATSRDAIQSSVSRLGVIIAQKREEDAQEATIISKGDTVEDNKDLRCHVLNLLLFSTDMARGSKMKMLASKVGLDDDRPRKLIQYIKHGGGRLEQLEALSEAIMCDYEEV